MLVACALTKGNIELEYNDLEYIEAVISKLEDSGAKIIKNNGVLNFDASDLEPESIDVTTGVYPGYPTDMQAQWVIYMALAKDTATVTDTIYIDRFKHVPELIRLGANIELVNNSAVIRGVKELKGAKVMSTDLRASASLVLAGLAAKGTTEVLRIYHIDRGYKRIDEKLRNLGANIKRVKTEEF
jgi:UDP-N-acetylglucosamine 1-carboxyvinyltransferase